MGANQANWANRTKQANWSNRTIFTGDNLDVMRGMNTGSVDLIYLDPPFNSNRDYKAPVGSPAEGAGFRDIWTLDDVTLEEHGELAERSPALYTLIDAAGLTHGKSMKAYLIGMGVRLLEMKRLLKTTGSIWLHCDDTAGYWLRSLMDSVFGAAWYRNEIVWKRTSAHNDPQRFGRITDTLFYYAAGKGRTWNRQFGEYSQEYLDRFFRFRDERGRYRVGDLTGSGTRTGETGQSWRGYNPTDSARHWSVPKRIVRKLGGDAALSRPISERLDLLDKHGYIRWPKRGGVPAFKSYLNELPGRPVQNLWEDIRPAPRRERVGYPTQKPLALLDRIIRASSCEGDMVLDPFCGCATACVAAEDLKRQWAGIDESPKAAELVIQRFTGTKQLTLLANRIIHRSDIPLRTDLGKLPNYRTHKHTLFGRQEGLCTGCGHAFPFRNFTVDHIVPQARGGTDHLDNLQLLCGACNSMKGAGTMAELKVKLRQAGILR